MIIFVGTYLYSTFDLKYLFYYQIYIYCHINYFRFFYLFILAIVLNTFKFTSSLLGTHILPDGS